MFPYCRVCFKYVPRLRLCCTLIYTTMYACESISLCMSGSAQYACECVFACVGLCACENHKSGFAIRTLPLAQNQSAVTIENLLLAVQIRVEAVFVGPNEQTPASPGVMVRCLQPYAVLYQMN